MNGPAPTPQWVYRAKLLGIHDGDTVTLTVDLGHRVHLDTQVRLLGVDAREVRGSDKPWGDLDTAFVQKWFADRVKPDLAWPLTIETEVDERDKYGRLLAYIWAAGQDGPVNDALLGHIALGGPPHGTRPTMRATP
jgi:micrococcal nuclease